MKVGKKYRLLGAMFDDMVLLENANIFLLQSIEHKGTVDESYTFQGVSTSATQYCYKAAIEAGKVLVQEVD